MYAILDDTGAHVQTVRSPINLRTADGSTLADASAVPVADLKTLGVYPLRDPGVPDQTWQTVTGSAVALEQGEAVLRYETEPLPLSVAKARVRGAIKQARDMALFGGYAWERAPGVVHLVQTDDTSQARLNAAYSAMRDGPAPPDGMPWRFADNTVARLTLGEMQALFLAVASHVAACYAAQAEREAVLADLPDMEACKAFDPTAGFPAPPRNG